MSKNRQGTEEFDELATLHEIERLSRNYIQNYYRPHKKNHDRAFAPGTDRWVESVEPLLEHLDDGRAGVSGESGDAGHEHL